MARPTNTELIRELDRGYTSLRERIDGMQRNADRVEATQSKVVEAASRLATRVAVLEEKAAELKKTTEEAGRRRHLLLLLFAGSLLTLLANIIVTLIRR